MDEENTTEISFKEYHKMVLLQALGKLQGKRDVLISLAVALFVGIVWWVTKKGTDNLLTAILSALFFCIAYIVIYLFYLRKEYVSIYNSQQKKIGDKNLELENYQTKQKLNLIVNHGESIFSGSLKDLPRITLIIDVENKETKEILNLEAHLIKINQITEDLPDDERYVHSVRYMDIKRLQWSNNKYIINLKPGLPKTSLKISELNCNNKEFMFIHEGQLEIIPNLQQDALYRIEIDFKGKLEGIDTDYKFFRYETEFICLPYWNQTFYLTEAVDFPYLPNWLKRKLNIHNLGTFGKK
jgi:Ca2+/Na+ antiporter